MTAPAPHDKNSPVTNSAPIRGIASLTNEFRKSINRSPFFTELRRSIDFQSAPDSAYGARMKAAEQAVNGAYAALEVAGYELYDRKEAFSRIIDWALVETTEILAATMIARDPRARGELVRLMEQAGIRNEHMACEYLACNAPTLYSLSEPEEPQP